MHPPQQRPPPGPPPVQQHAGGLARTHGMVSEDAMLWALLAHVLPILTSFLGPLCVWFLKKDSDPFVAYHSAQAFWFSLLTAVVVSLSCGMGGLFLPVFWVYGLYIGLLAKEGGWNGYPLIGSWGFDGKLR